MKPGLLLYWHTLRHLKPVQFYGRLLFRMRRPRPDLRAAPPLRPVAGTWQLAARRDPSLTGDGTFCFLGQKHDLSAINGWNDGNLDKLWLYNLHYFDTLNASNNMALTAQHQRLLTRWIEANPPGHGNGWEPYPMSLRIVNWIKWALAGNTLDTRQLNSLAIQVRWLAERLEIHLLGNHLFANAKALLFAGQFFMGPEADAWRVTALRILAREVPEQILADGAHFELSTMYHALALEDMLDLLNLAQAFDALDGQASDWRSRIPAMQSWLAMLSHPDGGIGFFNDAAFGIAVETAELARYADSLCCPAPPAPTDGVTHLAASGYLRLQQGASVLLLDAAAVGPDYLPGHAHADTLSFEWSLSGQRLLVNSGTSQYGLGAERLRQRGTAAHNTVQIDGADSSEVWSGFRVARRAYPHDIRIDAPGPVLGISCTHDGYLRLPGKNIHRRHWRLAAGELAVHDRVSGPFRLAEAFFHLHPAIRVAPGADRQQCTLLLPDDSTVHVTIDQGTISVQPGHWHPRFGVSQETHCLRIRFEGADLTTRFSWNYP
ncbi:heparinase II/III family protein [Janthinobacterium sp. LB2P70]|uniref:heparinase II/III family protein n=1 Tax=Janthinobacterium sp. LB2P70 TaxID=3424197 RepID=UPI003F24FA14